MNKKAFLSSVWDAGAASMAVDGNTDTPLDGMSCAHSLVEFRPWWAVDLGFATSVFEVEITNRKDCCSGKTDVYVAFVNSLSILGNTLPNYLHLY